MKRGLVIVSNRLPISVKKTDNGLEFFSSIGGLATGLARFAEEKMNKWIGWPGISTDQLTPEEKNEITVHFSEHNCYPIFLSQKQLDNYYSGYSNRILWPLCHGLPINSSALKKEDRYLKSYQEVNQLFASTILDLCPPGSNFWIHDYHLLLLPELIRKERPDAKIGYFQHIPFPESENFSRLVEAKSLINGLLGADLIGFHIKGYVEKFLDSCKRLEVGRFTKIGIIANKRLTEVSNFPMGIDYRKFADASKLPKVKEEMAIINKVYAGLKVIVTVDRLDPSKGLVERAAAYREFLRQNPSLHGKIIMIMQAMPSRTKIEEYISLHQQLTKIIDDTNDEFSTPTWNPIEYMYTCLTFNELQALYQLADIAFIAPLCDGMNLVAKEYVASKNNGNGVLILSKTAGAANELKDAILVDHAKPKSLVKAIEKALKMPKAEQKLRLSKMQKQISRSTVEVWYCKFAKTLFKTHNNIGCNDSSIAFNWKKNLVKSYLMARNPVIILDYDGTLASFTDNPDIAAPTEKLKSTLNRLALNKQCRIAIISGRSKNNLEKWFKDMPVTLIAEHGGFIKLAGDDRWETAQTFDNSWKKEVIKYFKKCVSNVPGSLIESKENSIVCHYRTANLDLAYEHLAKMKHCLTPLCDKLGLIIEQGNMIVEVRPEGVDKGVIANNYAGKSDFILAIGDDTSDEEMFKALPKKSWTVKVRFGKTAAKHRLQDVVDVHNLLEKLSKQ